MRSAIGPLASGGANQSASPSRNLRQTRYDCWAWGVCAGHVCVGLPLHGAELGWRGPPAGDASATVLSHYLSPQASFGAAVCARLYRHSAKIPPLVLQHVVPFFVDGQAPE